jgi:hypothetical protein
MACASIESLRTRRYTEQSRLPRRSHHQALAAIDRRLRRGAPCSARALLPSSFGNPDDPIMKKLLLFAPVALALAACGSSGPTRDASQPMVFVTSQRTTPDITQCLEDRLPRVRASSVGGATELAVGSDSNTSYFVTLTPSDAGSIIKVMRPANSPDDPPEPEMRFDIARCAT